MLNTYKMLFWVFCATIFCCTECTTKPPPDLDKAREKALHYVGLLMRTDVEYCDSLNSISFYDKKESSGFVLEKDTFSNMCLMYSPEVSFDSNLVAIHIKSTSPRNKKEVRFLLKGNEIYGEKSGYIHFRRIFSEKLKTHDYHEFWSIELDYLYETDNGIEDVYSLFISYPNPLVDDMFIEAEFFYNVN